MLKFLTGDILESSAECLVNTVNCEGYMGKGIAYQFKLRFPLNNKKYQKACKDGSLRIGTLHYLKEDGKWIVNFPTKDKWREKSKIEYIHTGLTELIKLLPNLNVRSLAIPPLGCGNGGLNWNDVKPIITSYLTQFADSMDIFVYEPSKYFKAKATTAPELNASHLVLMNLKLKMKKFNKLRLQKAAYFINVFSGIDYFKFSKYNYGPYAHSIDILNKDIKEFQQFYNVQTKRALEIAKSINISKSVENKLRIFVDPIEKSIQLINQIASDKTLELVTTICYILESKRKNSSIDEIIDEIAKWSQEKAEKFSREEIISGIDFLLEEGLVYVDLMGNYSLQKPNPIKQVENY